MIMRWIKLISNKSFFIVGISILWLLPVSYSKSEPLSFFISTSLEGEITLNEISNITLSLKNPTPFLQQFYLCIEQQPGLWINPVNDPVQIPPDAQKSLNIAVSAAYQNLDNNTTSWSIPISLRYSRNREIIEQANLLLYLKDPEIQCQLSEIQTGANASYHLIELQNIGEDLSDFSLTSASTGYTVQPLISHFNLKSNQRLRFYVLHHQENGSTCSLLMKNANKSLTQEIALSSPTNSYLTQDYSMHQLQETDDNLFYKMDYHQTMIQSGNTTINYPIPFLNKEPLETPLNLIQGIADPDNYSIKRDRNRDGYIDYFEDPPGESRALRLLDNDFNQEIDAIHMDTDGNGLVDIVLFKNQGQWWKCLATDLYLGFSLQRMGTHLTTPSYMDTDLKLYLSSQNNEHHFIHTIKSEDLISNTLYFQIPLHWIQWDENNKPFLQIVIQNTIEDFPSFILHRIETIISFVHDSLPIDFRYSLPVFSFDSGVFCGIIQREIDHFHFLSSLNPILSPSPIRLYLNNLNNTQYLTDYPLWIIDFENNRMELQSPPLLMDSNHQLEYGIKLPNKVTTGILDSEPNSIPLPIELINQKEVLIETRIRDFYGHTLWNYPAIPLMQGQSPLNHWIADLNQGPISTFRVETHDPLLWGHDDIVKQLIQTTPAQWITIGENSTLVWWDRLNNLPYNCLQYPDIHINKALVLGNHLHLLTDNPLILVLNKENGNLVTQISFLNKRIRLLEILSTGYLVQTQDGIHFLSFDGEIRVIQWDEGLNELPYTLLKVKTNHQDQTWIKIHSFPNWIKLSADQQRWMATEIPKEYSIILSPGDPQPLFIHPNNGKLFDATLLHLCTIQSYQFSSSQCFRVDWEKSILYQLAESASLSDPVHRHNAQPYLIIIKRDLNSGDITGEYSIPYQQSINYFIGNQSIIQNHRYGLSLFPFNQQQPIDLFYRWFNDYSIGEDYMVFVDNQANIYLYQDNQITRMFSGNQNNHRDWSEDNYGISQNISAAEDYFIFGGGELHRISISQGIFEDIVLPIEIPDPLEIYYLPEQHLALHVYSFNQIYLWDTNTYTIKAVIPLDSTGFTNIDQYVFTFDNQVLRIKNDDFIYYYPLELTQ